MLVDDLKKYSLLEQKLTAIKASYRKEAKPVREEKKLLLAEITKQVLEAAKTVQVGNIRAVYQPTVTIEILKEEDEDGVN